MTTHMGRASNLTVIPGKEFTRFALNDPGEEVVLFVGYLLKQGPHI